MTEKELDALTNDEYFNLTGLCRTRYQANKIKHTNPWYNGQEKIIAVVGGYRLMDADEWRVWKA